MSDLDFAMIDIDEPVEAPVTAPVVISVQDAYQNEPNAVSQPINQASNHIDQTSQIRTNMFNLSDSAVTSHTIEADPTIRRPKSINQSIDQNTNDQSTNQSLSTDRNTSQSATQSTDQSSSQSTNQSTNELQITENTNQTSSQSNGESDHSVNQSTNQESSPVETSEQSINQSTNQSINQSIAASSITANDQSTSQTGEQSTNQESEKSIDQSIDKSTNQSTSQEPAPVVYQSINPSNNQPITFTEIAPIERILDVSSGPRFLDSFTPLKPTINQSINQSINQTPSSIEAVLNPANQSIETEFRSIAANNQLRDQLSSYKKRKTENNPATSLPINQSTGESIIQLTNHSVSKSTSQSISQSINQSKQSKQAEIGDDFISLGGSLNQSNRLSKKFEVPKSHHFDPPSPWVTRNYSSPNFSFRLHEELLDFAAFFSPKKSEEEIRKNLVKKLDQLVVGIFPQSELIIFGSNATKLYLPMSDVDVVIFGVPEESNQSTDQSKYQSTLTILAEAIESAGWASYIEVISHARIPIIKYTDKTTGLKIDISINQSSGPDAAKWIQSVMVQQPAFRPLIIFLKYFLACRQLNDTYSGGIGSFLLQLMLFHHLMYQPSQSIDVNLGLLLIGFFDLYGHQLHYGNVGLQVSPMGYFSKQSTNRFNPARPFLLSVMNPLDATHDVGSNSFAVLKVRKSFQYSYSQLTRPDVIDESSAQYRRLSILALIVSSDDELVSERAKLFGNHQPLDQSITQSTNQSANQSVSKSISQPFSQSANQPKNPTIVLNPVIRLTVPSVNKVTDPPANQSVNQSTNQSTSRPVKTITLKRKHAEVEDQSINHSTNQSKKQATKPPVVIDRSRVTGQPPNQSINQSIKKSAGDDIIMIDMDDDDERPADNQSTSQSTHQSNNQSTNQSSQQSGHDVDSDHSSDRDDESANQSTNQSISQSVSHTDDELPALEQVEERPVSRSGSLTYSLEQALNPLDQSNNRSINQSVQSHDIELTARQLKRQRKLQREADAAVSAKKQRKLERRERKKAEKLELSQSINQSNNQSHNQSINQSIDQSNETRFVRADDGTMLIDLADSDDGYESPVRQLYHQSSNQSNSQSNNQSINQSIDQSNEDSDTSVLSSSKKLKKKKKKEKKENKLARTIQEVSELRPNRQINQSINQSPHQSPHQSKYQTRRSRANRQSNDQSINQSINQSASKKHKKKFHPVAPNTPNTRSNNQSINQSINQSGSKKKKKGKK